MGYQSIGRSETIQPLKSFWESMTDRDGGPSMCDFILCPPYVTWQVMSQEESMWVAVICSTFFFLLWPVVSVLLVLFFAGVACVECCERRDGNYEEPPEQARLDRVVNYYRENNGNVKNHESKLGNSIALEDRRLMWSINQAITDYCRANGIETETGHWPKSFPLLEEGSCRIVVDPNNHRRWWIEYTAGEEMKKWVENILTRSKTESSYISPSSDNQNRGAPRTWQYGSNDNTSQTLFFSQSNRASSEMLPKTGHVEEPPKVFNVVTSENGI